MIDFSKKTNSYYMKNITYLFGAGASANTIPVVAKFKKRVEEIIPQISESMRDHFLSSEPGISPHANYSTLIERVKSDLEFLIIVSKGHQTIDTVAKKFFLKNGQENNSELDRLKRSLILYFMLEQTICKESPSFKKTAELRYDGFIASTLKSIKSDLIFPENLKLLTWNYDLQFELSLMEYFDIIPMNELKNKFQILPRYSADLSKTNTEKFSLLKLNGEANVVFPGGVTTLFDLLKTGKTPATIYYDVLHHYNDLFFEGNRKGNFLLRNLTFAWETENPENPEEHKFKRMQNDAISFAKKTEILVVIGYSFPLFNREFDNLLFKDMPSISKLYIQDYNAKRIASVMTNSFNAFSGFTEANGQLVLEDSAFDQFIVPYELYEK